jgi:hypothetical protein
VQIDAFENIKLRTLKIVNLSFFRRDILWDKTFDSKQGDLVLTKMLKMNLNIYSGFLFTLHGHDNFC